MPTFISVMECLNHGPACVADPSLWLVWVVMAAGAALGWRWARSDRTRGLAIGRRLAWIGGWTVGLCLLCIVGYFVFAPDTIFGVEKNPFLNGLWILTVFVFGVGLVVLAAAAGLWIGRRLAPVA